MKCGRRISACLFVTAGLSFGVLSPSVAHANDPVTAEQLFADGKAAMQKGKIGEACGKFEESQRLDPSIGTEFNLADCNERNGNTATAWSQFMEVAALAHNSRQPSREEAARARASAIEPKLARLVIRVPSPDPKIEIVRDGILVGRAQWNGSVPVDPGEHRIVARSEGRKTWEKSVIISSTAVTSTVEVPELEVSTAPESKIVLVPSEERLAKRDAGKVQRVAGLSVLGLGLVGLGIGTAYGIASKTHRDDANGHCVGSRCDASGVGAKYDALADGNASTVAFAIGGAATITGALLFFTAPSETKERRALRAAPMIARGSGGYGIVVEGQFR